MLCNFLQNLKNNPYNNIRLQDKCCKLSQFKKKQYLYTPVIEGGVTKIFFKSQSSVYTKCLQSCVINSLVFMLIFIWNELYPQPTA